VALLKKPTAGLPSISSAYHGDALLLQFGPRYLEEWLVVVDDDAL
jgi:hypothetical protein